jgi:uncharacterized protein YdhG (YjbR/CyaY superfamily)
MSDTMNSQHRSNAAPKPKTFSQYLAKLDAGKRAALIRVRDAIRASAPNSEECISYGLPAFRLNGRFFVALGATAKKCSFYLGSTVRTHRKALKKFDTSKGTIRFSPDQPLSASLVRRLVRARIAEDPRFKKHV